MFGIYAVVGMVLALYPPLSLAYLRPIMAHGQKLSSKISAIIRVVTSAPSHRHWGHVLREKYPPSYNLTPHTLLTHPSQILLHSLPPFGDLFLGYNPSSPTRMFHLNAASDVNGRKRNFVLEFPYPPSFAELVARCEGVFTRARGGREFVVTNMQRFDAGSGWAPVTTMADAPADCQLYLFEADSWQTDMQQQIPPPERPDFTAAPHAPNPPREAAATHPTIHPTTHPTAHPNEPAPISAIRQLRRASFSERDAPRERIDHREALQRELQRERDLLRERELREQREVLRDYAAAPKVASPALLPAVAPPLSLPPGAPLAPPLGAPLAVPAAPPMAALAHHNNVSHEEKLTYTYSHIAGRHLGVVTAEDWLAACVQAGIPLAPATVSGLFVRADADKDGVLSEAEWRRLAEVFPALLESLYFRMRDDEENEAFESRLRELQIQINVSTATEQSAHDAALTASQAVRDLESSLSSHTIAADEAQHKHREVLQCHTEYSAIVLEAEAEKAHWEAAMRAQVDRHNTIVTEVNSCVDAHDAAALRHASSHDEAARTEHARTLAETAFHELQASLHTSEQKVQHLAEEVVQRVAVLGREGEGLEAAVREVAHWGDVVEAVEVRGRQIELAGVDAGVVVERTVQAAAAAAAECDAEAARYNSAVRHVADMEQRAVLCEAESARSANALTTLSNEHAAYTQRRRLVEEQERPLVEEELRLRERRHMLQTGYPTM